MRKRAKEAWLGATDAATTTATAAEAASWRKAVIAVSDRLLDKHFLVILEYFLLDYLQMQKKNKRVSILGHSNVHFVIYGVFVVVVVR